MEWPVMLPITSVYTAPELSPCEVCQSVAHRVGYEYSVDTEDVRFLSRLKTNIPDNELLCRFESLISCLEYEKVSVGKGHLAHSCVRRLVFKEIAQYWKKKRERQGPLVRKNQMNPLLENWQPV